MSIVLDADPDERLVDIATHKIKQWSMNATFYATTFPFFLFAITHLGKVFLHGIRALSWKCHICVERGLGVGQPSRVIGLGDGLRT